MASSRKLHPDELDIDEALVRRMVAEQFPQWAGLPVEPVEPAGTSNAMYRLGAELVVRIPRIPGVVEEIAKEDVWLRRLARGCRSRCRARWPWAGRSTAAPGPGRCCAGWTATPRTPGGRPNPSCWPGTWPAS